MCSSATTKARQVILDFDIVSEIITFEEKGRYGIVSTGRYVLMLIFLWQLSKCKDKYVL